ncbi:MAG: LytTR family DNA-binding domain-containing protein [Prevotella sp.]|jgi:DNA-binding LytR/AlgR family response regulator|nr:LytTR family DNA-binding domain-containing protein [Prevotella sp.]
MEIKCIITDDEPIARKGLRSYIEKIDFLTLTGECEDAIQLNTTLKTAQSDLLFLDIEMPHISGIELLSSIHNPPKVIIISAYEQYALKGYELDVVDYLLKPVSSERFLKAVNKVHDLLEKETKNTGEKYVFVKSDKQLKKILLKEILFIESMENYITIYTTSSKEIVYTTLKHMLDSLPGENFLQVHRSYIANIEHIKSIEGNLLNIGTHKIPVARNLRDKVFNIILNNRLISKP